MRKLAGVRISAESPGQTLDATALVHEAYLRLVGEPSDRTGEPSDVSRRVLFDGRGHFFAAAAEAMRRVLVDRARGKARLKRGGGYTQIDLKEIPGRAEQEPDLILTLDECLSKLAIEDALAANVAQLHLFAGLSIDDVAQTLNISRATAYRNWTYARAWLQDALSENP